MKVLITGATGFVGAGVLAEALASELVTEVVALGRSASKVQHPKLRSLQASDFADLAGIEEELGGFDACFWCLGTSSGGMSEADYRRITYDYAIEAAQRLGKKSPGLHFAFLSGSGADGSAMWARVKKDTEVALAGMVGSGLGGVSIYRPAFIQDRHGGELRGLGYKAMYAAVSLFSPLVRAAGGGTSNAEIGQAMLVAARDGLDALVLDSKGINGVAARL